MRYMLLMLCLFLCSCSTTTYKECIDKPALSLSVPEKLVLDEVEFVIVHKDNAETVFKELEVHGIEPVLFALTGTDYKALALNIEKIKNFILIQRKIIQLYKDYYEGKKDGGTK